ncbi:MAG: hypothetical protein LC100_10750, partial [Chitinophagales bacterium]|nr:hypothetical protein [Chitinophagales bacterium]
SRQTKFITAIRRFFIWRMIGKTPVWPGKRQIKNRKGEILFVSSPSRIIVNNPVIPTNKIYHRHSAVFYLEDDQKNTCLPGQTTNKNGKGEILFVSSPSSIIVNNVVIPTKSYHSEIRTLQRQKNSPCQAGSPLQCSQVENF